MLIGAALVQALAMIVFATADGVPALIVARVVQGLATGAAAGAIGAGMLDIDRAKGTIANAVAPMTGTALGGLVSGLLVQHLPAPTQLVYLALLAIFVAQALGVAFMPETSPRKTGALASLRPAIRLPPAARHAVLIALPALVAAWALAGFYGSLGPLLVKRLVGSTSFALGGIALFVLAASGGAAVLAFQKLGQRAMHAWGTGALVGGVALTLLAIDGRATVLFFAGSVVAGGGFGLGFRGAIGTVLPLAKPDERAGLSSVLYIISYVAMGAPAVLGGAWLVHTGDVFATARAYGFVVMALSTLALASTLVEGARERARAGA